jgi:hypothetical protein
MLNTATPENQQTCKMTLSSKAAAIPSYRRHKASGQAVVTLNGVDHYLGPWNTHQSRAEYDRVLHEWLARGRQLGGKGKDAESDPMLMKELIRGYPKPVRQGEEYERVVIGECLVVLRRILAGTGGSLRLELAAQEEAAVVLRVCFHAVFNKELGSFITPPKDTPPTKRRKK